MFDKPQLRDIRMKDITIDNLEYFCKTSFIDKIRMDRLKKPFDQKLADAMESKSRHYFVVLKNRTYDIVPGDEFEKKLSELWPASIIITPKVQQLPDPNKNGEVFKLPIGSKVEFIEPIHQNLTAKAAACIDHYIKRLG